MHGLLLLHLHRLLDDPRVWGPVASLCGDDFTYTSGDGNYYAGDTSWHSDGYGSRQEMGMGLSIKMAFYLDKLTKDTGCVRFIPGSRDPPRDFRLRTRSGSGNSTHCEFFDGAAPPKNLLDPRSEISGPGHKVGDSYGDALQATKVSHEYTWGVGEVDIPCVYIESEPGDIVIFDHNLVRTCCFYVVVIWRFIL